MIEYNCTYLIRIRYTDREHRERHPALSDRYSQVHVCGAKLASNGTCDVAVAPVRRVGRDRGQGREPTRHH